MSKTTENKTVPVPLDPLCDMPPIEHIDALLYYFGMLYLSIEKDKAMPCSAFKSDIFLLLKELESLKDKLLQP